MGTQIYVGLRLLNTVLAILWGFALMAILIRVVGIHDYAYYVLIGAIGMYIASTDLGVSNVLYARLRAAFLKGEISALIAPARGAIMVYVLVAAATTLGYVGWTVIGSSPRSDVWPTLILFFLITIANFPWIVVRSAVAAVDRHLEFEAIDFVRRAGQFVGLLLLARIGPVPAFVLIDLLWLGAFILAAWNIRAGGITGFSLAPARISADLTSFVRAFGPLVAHSAVFVLCEAAIYNFPYLLIPLVYSTGVHLILFDVFYKFVRAAISANQVFSMGLLPHTTRHHFSGDRKALIDTLVRVLLLSLAGMIAMNVLIALLQPHILGVLLHDRAGLVTPVMLAAITIASLANAIQNTFGSYIVNIGEVSLARSLSLTIAAAFSLVALATWMLRLSFDTFVLTYAVTYLCGALAWAAKALAIIGRLHACTASVPQSGMPT